jgi:hypothetical protein
MRLPDALPIVGRRTAQASHRSFYEEPELTLPVDLCDSSGRLNPAAVGWSRTPLVRANLSGHWPRKKRWNFWSWIAPEFVLSVTVADIDYAAFCDVSFTDFASGRTISAMAPKLPGRLEMPEHVERTIALRGGRVEYRNANQGDRLEVTVRARAGDVPIAGDFTVAVPPGHESVNVVVPWTRERFQMNSKHAALATTGHLDVGGRRFEMRPEECHAVQDFGRGLWPYRSFWNWGVAMGVAEGELVAVNVGGKWTTGTGSNENGIIVGGRVHKVMEDLEWAYDPSDWMRPWRVRAPHSGMVDLELTPIVARTSRVGWGPLRSGGVCCFGRWSGTIRFAGRELTIRSLLGWAEEFDHRW